MLISNTEKQRNAYFWSSAESFQYYAILDHSAFLRFRISCIVVVQLPQLFVWMNCHILCLFTVHVCICCDPVQPSCMGDEQDYLVHDGQSAFDFWSTTRSHSVASDSVHLVLDLLGVCIKGEFTVYPYSQVFDLGSPLDVLFSFLRRLWLCSFWGLWLFLIWYTILFACRYVTRV